MSPKDTAIYISDLILDKKGTDIKIIDISEITSISDIIVICTSDSDPKTKAIYDHISVGSAYENLNKIKKYASRFNGVDEPTKAHRKHLVYLIDKALDT